MQRQPTRKDLKGNGREKLDSFLSVKTIKSISMTATSNLVMQYMDPKFNYQENELGFHSYHMKSSGGCELMRKLDYGYEVSRQRGGAQWARADSKCAKNQNW